ncbi:MAG: hypothetical protein K2X27_13570 [Candidatus Obscuribacterales bacterium]|nr:hypothetical protein [Candidatus Obscuribacterales bacterium]
MQLESESIKNSTPDKDKETFAAVAKEFLILAGIYLFFRLPFLFIVPMSEAPDEFAHFWVIKFLKENLSLPSAAQVQAGGESAVYGSLPQLGYIPHVVCGFLGGSEQLAMTERLGSLLMGLLMLWAAYSAAKLLFRENKLARLAVPAAIASHPQLAFIHAYANNDSTSSALASILLFLALQSLSSGLLFRRTVLIGILVGWLALSKYSGLAIIPVLALALISSIFIHGSSIGSAVFSFLLAALVAISLSGWWFIQNAQQYPGDFMGTKTMYLSWAKTFHRDIHYYLPASHIIKDHRWWRMSFFSYWGLFGYMNKYLWKFIYFIYLGLVLSAVAGWIRGLFRAKSYAHRKTEILMWSCLGLTVLINISSMIWASVYNLGGPQGRYLITSEIPIMALLIGGFSLFGKSIGRILTLSLLSLNTAVTIGTWIYLFLAYGGLHSSPLP